MTPEEKTKIENVYALDRELQTRLDNGEKDKAGDALDKLEAHAFEMVDIIRSLEAKVEAQALEIKELKSCN